MNSAVPASHYHEHVTGVHYLHTRTHTHTHTHTSDKLTHTHTQIFRVLNTQAVQHIAVYFCTDVKLKDVLSNHTTATVGILENYQSSHYYYYSVSTKKTPPPKYNGVVLVHGQVAVIFVVSVSLFVCAVFLSRL